MRDLRADTRARLANQPARRRFGQNFLVDADAVTAIVSAARIVPGEPVTEVGPGLGTLTRALVAAGADVTAVELDRDLAAALDGVRVVQADALRYPFRDKVVANLPYNVATPILMRILAARVPHAVLMFQREVGDRIVATPDDDAYGALSVQVQARAGVSVVRELPPWAFQPRPKVWSVVLDIRPFAAPDFGGVAAEAFDRVVRAGFAQRRKTLRNSLGSVYPDPVPALEAAGIDPSRRAETVDLAGWRRLAAGLETG